MKRVVVGGLHHESNTFNPIVTGRDDIYVYHGDEIFEHLGDNSITGAINHLRANNYEIVPTIVARAVPNGEWDQNYYLELKSEFLQRIKDAGHVDAFCLSLHGSMRVKGIGKAETDILAAVRELYPTAPIFASLDMHGTVTADMMKYADGFVGYKTAPHVDEPETGEHAARMTRLALEEGMKATMSICHVPMLIAGEQSETSVEPMVTMMKAICETETRDGVLAASFLLGYPWADTEDNGVTAVVVTSNNQELADTEARRLGELFWTTRKEFHFYNDTRPPKEALLGALEFCKTEWPVVISDSGDNPTAGSSQDVTNFLKMILANDEARSLSPPLVYQGFYDPEVVTACIATGVGGEIEMNIGARFDAVTSSPVHAKMTVRAVCPQWIWGPVATDMALVDLNGIDVVVTSKHVGMYDPEMMRALGVSPEARKIIIVKLGYLEPELRALAKKSIMALTDGSTNELLESIPYVKIHRPMFPLDKDFESNLCVTNKQSK